MKDKQLLALVTRAMQHDRQAFVELCQKRAREVVYLCDVQLQNRQDAEDAAQEVFIRMQRNIHRLRSAEAFNVWLNRLVFTTCHNYRRDTMKNKTALPLEELDIELADDTPDVLPDVFVEDAEKRRQLARMVEELPKKYRACLVLHYYQGLRYTEIAEVLHIAPGAVESRLRTGRKILRAQLEEAGLQPAGTANMAGFGLVVGTALQGAANSVPAERIQSCLARAKIGRGPFTTWSRLRAALQTLLGLALVTVVVAIGVLTTPFSPFTVSSSAAQSLPQGFAAVAGNAGENAEPSLAMPTQLSGRVRMVAGDTALISGTLYLLDPQGTVKATTQVGPDGRYTFTGLQLEEAGQYILRLSAQSAGGEVYAEDVTLDLYPQAAGSIPQQHTEELEP